MHWSTKGNADEFCGWNFFLLIIEFSSRLKWLSGMSPPFRLYLALSWCIVNGLNCNTRLCILTSKLFFTSLSMLSHYFLFSEPYPPPPLLRVALSYVHWQTNCPLFLLCLFAYMLATLKWWMQNNTWIGNTVWQIKRCIFALEHTITTGIQDSTKV